ncbi:hypothetical protein LTR37_001568 [Vermiconidia calcicola]|uniref:Uncharacterized protein n=1 Tax=Vermiconidia calcicola TaxID=1690605 RepID=A0ACC3NW39_9PEZI|nr:hypothetical protein LTR37_001568 [Vermiconidia calcicola]
MSQRGSWQALPQEVRDLIYGNCIVTCRTAIKHPEPIDHTPYIDSHPTYATLPSIAIASKKDYFDFFNVCQGLTIHEITLTAETELLRHQIVCSNAQTATHLFVRMSLDAWAEEPQPLNVQYVPNQHLKNTSNRLGYLSTTPSFLGGPISRYPLEFSSYYTRPRTIGGRPNLSSSFFTNGAYGPNPQHRLIQPHSRIFEQVLHAFPNVKYLAVEIGGNQPLLDVRPYEIESISDWAHSGMFTVNQSHRYQSYSLIVAPGHPGTVANWTSGAGGRYRAELGREGQVYTEWLVFLEEMGADRSLRKIVKKKQDDEFGRSKVPLLGTREEEVVEQGGVLVVRLPCMTSGRWVEGGTSSSTAQPDAEAVGRLPGLRRKSASSGTIDHSTKLYNGQVVFIANFKGLSSETNVQNLYDIINHLAMEYGKLNDIVKVESEGGSLELRAEYMMGSLSSH